MRALLPNLPSLLGSLTLTLGLLSLVACTADHGVVVTPPEINTYNAYVNDADNSLNYYSVVGNTRQTYRIANFAPTEAGFENALFLDVSEEKQGFEYVAYVTKGANNISSINLFDLDKANNGARHLLTTTDKNVCGIRPRQIPSSQAFSLQQPTNLDTIHAPEVIIQVSQTADCSGPFYHEQVDFSDLVHGYTTSEPRFEHTYIPNDEADALLVINYGSGVRVNSVWYGNYGYVSYDEDFSRVSFNYYEVNSGGALGFNNVEVNELTWDTLLAFDEPMTFKSASAGFVLFQQGRKIYVVPVNKLFTIDDLSSSSSSAPTQAQIDALFAQPSLELAQDVNPTITLNKAKKQTNFVMQVENTLYIYKDNNFSKIFEASDEAELSFLLNKDNEVLVLIKEEGEQDQLTIISGTGVSKDIISADEINISQNNDVFFVNSVDLNPNGDGAQAHIIQNVGTGYDTLTFEDSVIIHARDTTNTIDFPLLISSGPVQNVSGTRQREGIYLYKFDSTERLGRAQAQSSRQNESGNVEFRLVDFSYGIFNELTSIEFLSGSIINDYYGLLQFKATLPVNGVEKTSSMSFAFDPSQSTPDPEIVDQSLALLVSNIED